METSRNSRLSLLLLALLHICIAEELDCPSTDNVFTEFTCHNDYNRIITCVWSSARVFNHANTVCTVSARKTDPVPSTHCKFSHRHCVLKPVNGSSPSLMSCSMDLRKKNAFQYFETWSIDVNCSSSNQTLNIVFMPGCSIKPNPPENPHVNFTTVSWTITNPKNEDILHFKSQLQWKQEDRPWSDPSVKTVHRDSYATCVTELNPDELFEGQAYEARVRVLVSESPFKSTWSGWSPTTSWVSPVGKTKPPDVAGDVWGMIVAGTVVFAVFLLVIFIRTNRWVNKIRVSPIPSPATSFLQKANFQSWLSPHFTSDSFHSFLQPEEILYVEVTSSVDAVAPFTSEAPLLEKMQSERSSGSGRSNFSNPSYSHLCSPPPFSSLSVGNLQPCAADTPYGPVVNQGANTEQKQDAESGEEPDILQLLSKGGKDSESVQVISDYEKFQVERMRLQSLDSGVCSGEEVSQESLEADSINVTDGHEEEPLNKEQGENRGNGEEADFKKLCRGSGGVFGKGSIQVCSGYEHVQKMQANNLELCSLDSGVSSGGEEQVSQEDVVKASDSTSFLSAPTPAFSVPSPAPSFPHLPLKVPELGNRADLQILLNHMAENNASDSRSVAPSADGYMPARQEPS